LVIGHGSAVKKAAAGVALTAGMLLVTACGSSSDSNKSSAETSTATKAAVEPKTKTSATARPEDSEETAIFDEQVAAGTVRLATVAIGIPGGVVDVKPAGLVNDKFKYNHFYKPGTEVTLRARESDEIKFAAWSGACQGTSRTCKLKVDDTMRVLAGFLPKK
jgi:hypothetical protein